MYRLQKKRKKKMHPLALDNSAVSVLIQTRLDLKKKIYAQNYIACQRLPAGKVTQVSKLMYISVGFRISSVVFDQALVSGDVE